MAIKYKVLGQSAPLATTLTDIYTVPAGTESIVSTISASSRTLSSNIRIAVRPGGAPIADEHYIVHDVVVQQFEALFLTVGITLDTGDVISVYNEVEEVSFSVFGSEIT